MGRTKFLFAAALAAHAACGSWYWPFGGGDDEDAAPRISELMEPASLLIDEASDLAEERKTAEAVEKYRLALAELERIELENPERAATGEFSTVRNKKAYVNSAIDSLLLEEARRNAKAIAITDTTVLEKRLAREKADLAASRKPVREVDAPAGPAESAGADAPSAAEPPPGGAGGDASASAAEARLAKIREALAANPRDRKARLMLAAEDLRRKDYASARLTLKELLGEKPNDAPALNMRAAVEAAEGDLEAARNTLLQSVRSNPKSHFAYYNLARLALRRGGAAGKETARRYYENGREYCSGPRDAALEEMLK